MKQVVLIFNRIFLLLMPILFLPVSVDAFGLGKHILMAGLTLVGLILWAIEFLSSKNSEIKFNSAWWMLLVVTIWAWVGWYQMLPGVRMRTITDVSGVGVLTMGLIWFFVWLQTSNQEERSSQLNWMTASGLLVAVLSVIVFLIPQTKFPISFPQDNPLISITTNWSLTGFVVTEVLLMLFLGLVWSKRLISKLKDGNYMVEAGMTSFFSLVLLLDIFKIIRTGWINLDGYSAWVIAVETFKRSPIWGVGAGNFINAFSNYRPDSYNLTANWATSYLHSSNGLLNLWTELGIVGLVLVIVSVLKMLKLKKNFDFGILLVLVLAGLFLPVSVLGLMLLVWMVSGMQEAKKVSLVMKVGENGFNIAPMILSILLFIFSLFGGFWIYKIVAADVTIRSSMVAATKNNGGDTYNLQIKAIGLNPDNADYRMYYSQTNLALASTLLANKEISEEDKQKASTLVQQSVREGKAAIALDQTNSVYWLNLATIYRQLVGVVEGSADWSYQAYSQAVVLEPSNPISKLDLGGLLFAANKFEEADRIFEQVVTAKPDFANGWYNWAYTAKQLKKIDFAVARLTQAVSLVPTTSGDYEKANAELIEWKKELAASTQSSVEPMAESLKTAEPLPTGGKEQVVVPTGAELEPPVVLTTPTVTN